MIEKTNLTKLSRFLSLVLRHKPDEIGIRLDSNGWTDVNQLMERMIAHGKKIDFETLMEIVEVNDKKRFSFNADKTFIRANQGHSIEIDLAYTPKMPPHILYHGTATQYVNSIYESGAIRKMKRHHVHLSKDLETAELVGQRHGFPVVFEIITIEMVNEGIEFYESNNGVWLTEEVPVRFIRKIDL